MDEIAIKKLRRKIFLLFPLALFVMAGMLFIPAGSLKYWQGWVFCAVILAPPLFTAFYFFKKSPEFLERRMRYKEKEKRQRAIIKLSGVFFFVGFLVPGLDFRFGWSSVPAWLAIASNIIVLASYLLVFLAFKENTFAARTVEVFEGQKVIDTGPYAAVRHPMYAGVIPMLLFMSLALGSFWAVIFFLPVCASVIVRALDEERVLKRDLPGYGAYCEKVRYRLLPGVW